MKHISIQDLKARLSAAVSDAESGDTIVITRHSEAVAKLTPADIQNVHRGKAADRRGIKPEQYKTAIDRLEQDRSLFILRDLTLDSCQSNTLPAVVTPRSFGLAHLRTALWFHNEKRIARFITMDSSQEQTARELELPG